MKDQQIIYEKIIGKEPIFRKEISERSDTDVCKALNWYSYTAEEKPCNKWLNEYMKKNMYSKKDIDVVLNESFTPTKRIAASLIKMTINGTIFVGEMKNIIDEKIKDIIFNSVKLVEKEEASGEPAKVISIQDRIKAIADQHIVILDDEIFSWHQEKRKKITFCYYDYLQKTQLNSQVCNHINTYVTKVIDEYQEMMSGNCEQLNEAYSYLPLAVKKEILKTLTGIANDIQRYVGNAKAAKPRKPKKKKVVPAHKQINSLKYQKEFNKLKLKSINPESIIGCQQLWVFNTKYNQLAVYNALGPSGLSVKGTTLYNYDEDSSIKKTLRKPEETLNKVLTGGKNILKKIMIDIKTKNIEANGRINEDTIILKAIN